MTHALHDFRIENENLILLSFSNGTSARVCRDDLERYLSKPDLAKVNKAMSQRRKFMKRVLPPTAVFLLSASILALGAHDARQLMNQWKPAESPAPQSIVAPQPEPWVQNFTQPKNQLSSPQLPVHRMNKAPAAASPAPVAAPGQLKPSPAASPAEMKKNLKNGTNNSGPHPAILHTPEKFKINVYIR